MIEVIIPVHPLSRKILISEYGSEPIRIGQHDLLFKMLSYTRALKDNNLAKLNDTMVAEVSFLLHKDFAHSIYKRSYQIGDVLFAHHVDLMMRHTLAQLRKGEAARYAIHDFYALYGIDEDDYELDSAYKRWHRFKKNIEKNQKIICAKFRSNGSDSRKKSFKELTKEIPLDEDRITEAVLRFEDCYSGVSEKIPAKLITHADYYFRTVGGHHSTAHVAQKIKVPQRSVQYGVLMIRNRIETDPVFKKLVETITADMRD